MSALLGEANQIYIIGNGFDLAHGLKTGYANFINFIVEDFQQSQPQLTADIISFKRVDGRPQRPTFNRIFSINDLKGTFFKIGPHYDDYNFQCTLEVKNRLLKRLLQFFSEQDWVDVERFYFECLIEIANPPERGARVMYRYPEDYGVASLNRDFEQIRQLLLDYLKLEVENNNASLLGGMGTLFEDCISSTYQNRYFLNFNYTDTILKYTSSVLNSVNDQVINIHGSINEHDNVPVFGYSPLDEDISLIKSKSPTDNEPMRFFKEYLYLKCANKIELLNDLLLSSSHIEIFVLGHSLGISDAGLLSRIFNHPNVRSIEVIYYEDSEKGFNTYDGQVQNILRLRNDNPTLMDKVVKLHDSKKFPQQNDV